MNEQDAPMRIEINISQQRLCCYRGDALLMDCPVSTAKNGAGEIIDSECTPRGQHVIVEKIGAGCPVNTIFVGRRPTGELCSPELRAGQPGRDWILTRILWLGGVEPGKNQGGEVDTKARYIYVHGAPDDIPMGRPGSRGCIRMRNQDVVQLFELVESGTPVYIHE
jgi:L,D-transpeptidase YbiS